MSSTDEITVHNLPRTIQLGAMAYQVAEVDIIQEDERGSVLGRIEDDQSRILIKRRIDSRVALVFLWHELVHAMLFRGGILEHDEAHVQCLANGIVEILQRNAELVERTIHTSVAE